MISDKMFRFRPDEHRLRSAFLLMYLRSAVGQAGVESLKTGSNDSGLRISQSAFTGLPVPVPPVALQDALVRKAEDLADQVAASEADLERTHRRATALRRSILAAAFSGQLVPQDLSDEPASVLLERIVNVRTMSKPSRKKKAES